MDDQLEQLVDNYLVRLRDGTAPSLDAYCREHPNHTDGLQRLIPSMQMLERNRPRLGGMHANGPASTAEFAGLTLGDFVVEKEIGRGGMGVVYKAHQRSLGRSVALKVLHRRESLTDNQRERFRREAAVAASLHHTSIIPVFGAGEADECQFYAMQLIDGTGLIAWSQSQLRAVLPETDRMAIAATTGDHDTGLSKEIQLPHVTSASAEESGTERFIDPREVARIGMEVADALHYAHTRRVLHRDIKPGNILIDGSGHAWVSDFGLAQQRDATDLTREGDFVGTLRYMAPERFAGICDERADVYGLGVSLFELLTGRPAIQAAGPAEVMHEILNAKGLQLDCRNRIPVNLRLVIDKAIHVDVDERYASANDLAADFRRFLEDRPVHARKPSILRAAVYWGKRNPLAALLTAATAITLVTATVLSLLMAAQSHRSAELAAAESRRSRNLLNLSQQVTGELTSGLVREYLSKMKKLNEGQEAFLERIVHYNKQFDELAENDHQSRAFRGLRLRQTAAIKNLLGDRQGAEVDLRASVDSWRALQSEFPAELQYPVEVANSLIELGNSLISQGKRRDALATYFEARDQLDQLPDEISSSELVLRNQATIENNIGNIAQETEDFATAMEAYEKAIAIQEAMLERSAGDDQNDRDDYSRSLHNLGLTLLKMEKPLDAKHHAQRALQIRKLLVAQFPDNVDFKRNYNRTLVVVGRTESGLDMSHEARERFRESVSISERMVAEYPAVLEYKVDLADSLEHFAAACQSLKHYADVEQTWYQVIKVLSPVVAERPDLVPARSGLASGEQELATLLKESRPAEALELAASAARHWQHLAEQVPEAGWAVDKWADAMSLLGRICWQNTGDHQAAIEHFTIAEQLFAKIGAEFPSYTSLTNANISRARAATNIGRIYNEMDQPNETIQWLDRATELLNSITAANEKFAESRQILSIAIRARAAAVRKIRTLDPGGADANSDPAPDRQ